MSTVDDLYQQAITQPPPEASSPLATLQLLAQLKASQATGAPVGGLSSGASAPSTGLSPMTGGTLQQWIDRAEQITGTSNVPNVDNMLRILISHESGGNPTIVNSTPTPRGYHAEGLAQMIVPTFQHYAIPGLGGIFNPVANLSAAIKYMIDKYGSIANTPGIASVLAGHGYQPY
jgi:hypothetical protein